VISQGTEIPYLTAAASGATTVVFKPAVLELSVTPRITPDDRIIMDLDVKKDAVGQVFSGVPSVDTKKVSTQVLVDNGDTIVLGGIFEQETRVTTTKVPLLGDLPVVGALFRNVAKQDDKTELLIFVTPKIVKDTLTVR
jgi:type IV pilus assembly protein PilQ